MKWVWSEQPIVFNCIIFQINYPCDLSTLWLASHLWLVLQVAWRSAFHVHSEPLSLCPSSLCSVPLILSSKFGQGCIQCHPSTGLCSCFLICSGFVSPSPVRSYHLLSWHGNLASRQVPKPPNLTSFPLLVSSPDFWIRLSKHQSKDCIFTMYYLLATLQDGGVI